MSAPPPETYLAPGFNPAKLTVPQLRQVRSVLLAHGHGYSARIKKDELVREFETHIASQASALRRQAAAVVPSDAGIVSVSDAGEETPAVPTKRPRRSSRRSTAEPESTDVELPDQTEVTPEPPAKRSRSKAKSVPVVEIEATPRRGGKKNGQPVIQVEDVDEGVDGKIEDELPKVAPTPSRRTTRGRSSMTPVTPATEPPTSARTPKVPRSARKSEPAIKVMENLHEESERDDTPKKKTARTPRRSAGDEPAFSDFNPFQSGSEAAAEKARRRRKSSIGFATSTRKPDQPRYSEPGSDAVTPPGILRRMGPSRENLRTPPSEVKRRLAEGDLDDAVAYNHEVQNKLNQISRNAQEDAQVVVHTSTDAATDTEKSLATRVNDQITHNVPAPRATLPLSVLFLLLLTFITNFKSQSSSIGFCDTAYSSNEIALSRLSSRTAAEKCLEERARLDATDRDQAKHIQCDTSNLPLVPFLPVPFACTPCPAHAQCSNGEIVACEPEYLLSPSYIAFLSPLVDGLPTVGPRAFPPVCKPDTRLKRLIGSMAKELESSLAQHRGDVICEGTGGGSDGERFGEEEEALREKYAGMRRQGVSREEFDQIFEAAIKDLVEHEDLIVSIDVENNVTRYAAARTDLTLVCRGKLEAADLLDRWKSQLGSTAAVLTLIAYIRSEVSRRKEDKYRAASLASVALRRIQDQEQLHYTDPASTPNPFIPRDQLRDLVMPHKGATLGGSKARMWEKVVELVEGNANVTVREQEVKGEIWKTWEWSGVGERPIAHVTWEE
ncbi:hypothetical protein L198_04252 [Cryptococcus wingfieldii CBS 7118]|uniref:Man1/Src1-like C-terminal domain-containing protein n=1 Tax=Cryptococcus wingfieldii CBS 7118 TaxID=1295528 RepID=A0A1E3J6P8_9TREE|nr:hypothetical protein L198_04252 [Cryptococcus wingfieldii CBS 7118]ODN96537.1 hypothetical protein L198_04252 [Cryptococcus wingfieldii CBS 7118]